MSSRPPSARDGYESNLIVRTAVESLKEFGGPDLAYAGARQLLSLWRDGHALTEQERTAVLSRFPRQCHDVTGGAATVMENPGLSGPGW